MLIKSQKLVIYSGAWAFFVLAVITVFNIFSYEIFFMLALIGFIILAELTCPYVARPKWMSRLYLVIFIGMLIFFLMVLNKALDIIGLSILP